MPKSLGEEEIVAAVQATIAEMGSPTMKDMGTVMKAAMAEIRRRAGRWETSKRGGEEGVGCEIV